MTEREAQAGLAEIAVELVAVEDRLTRIGESLTARSTIGRHPGTELSGDW